MTPTTTSTPQTATEDAMDGRRLGFVGLGNMGGRMTRRLVEAGLDVLGFDTVAGRAAEVGAEPAASLGEVAAHTDVILLSLPDSTVVEKVMGGSEGLLRHTRKGQVIIDLSTSAPASTTRLGAELAERGATLVDAGISGGAAAADKGTLTLMTGGDAAVIESLAWAFDPISSAVFHMGPLGAGHSTKLLNNFLNAVALSATAEVMVAGAKAGLDLHRLLDVLNSSSGVNFATLNRFPKIVDGDYLEGGLTGRLMTKDVVAYVEHLGKLGVPSLNAAAPLAAFGLATQLGYGDQISNRVVDAIGDLAGGIRVHSPEAQGGQE
ncbi:NAD(P)-dependent oxidoreductase [Pseudonocardia lutea]|uniref:NAD(P)-dependent oxidoreductase n=1 Tax=Pseudonocardia lutea TaxID=2172015 RepID=A0ABW1HZT9_9PSEU